MRSNDGGRLVTQNYGQVTALSLDPIEKKPMYHFHPGHLILSVSSYGCNLSCDFCQNWELSQGRPGARTMTPEAVLRAVESAGDKCIGVAYTLNEPTVWYEFVYDTARVIHDAGYCNVLVTNGFINPEPLRELLPMIDAANVDLKAFDARQYALVCGGLLEPVRTAIEEFHGAGVHLEVTTLIIPGVNDDDEQLSRMYEWLAGVSERIPVHVSRYFPDYKRTTPATPIETLVRAATIARQYLTFVYTGNLAFANSSHTRCPSCGTVLVERSGYVIRPTSQLREDECGNCGTPSPFIGRVLHRIL